MLRAGDALFLQPWLRGALVPVAVRYKSGVVPRSCSLEERYCGIVWSPFQLPEPQPPCTALSGPADRRRLLPAEAEHFFSRRYLQPRPYCCTAAAVRGAAGALHCLSLSPSPSPADRTERGLPSPPPPTAHHPEPTPVPPSRLSAGGAQGESRGRRALRAIFKHARTAQPRGSAGPGSRQSPGVQGRVRGSRRGACRGPSQHGLLFLFASF